MVQCCTRLRQFTCEELQDYKGPRKAVSSVELFQALTVTLGVSNLISILANAAVQVLRLRERKLNRTGGTNWTCLFGVRCAWRPRWGTSQVLDTDFTNKLTLSLGGRAKFKPIYWSRACVDPKAPKHLKLVILFPQSLLPVKTKCTPSWLRSQSVSVCKEDATPKTSFQLLWMRADCRGHL